MDSNEHRNQHSDHPSSIPGVGSLEAGEPTDAIDNSRYPPATSEPGPHSQPDEDLDAPRTGETEQRSEPPQNDWELVGIFLDSIQEARAPLEEIPDLADEVEDTLDDIEEAFGEETFVDPESMIGILEQVGVNISSERLIRRRWPRRRPLRPRPVPELEYGSMYRRRKVGMGGSASRAIAPTHVQDAAEFDDASDPSSATTVPGRSRGYLQRLKRERLLKTWRWLSTS
ncbi:hypothetical protein ACJZ2D_002239 [Fusarium nematophilum]